MSPQEPPCYNAIAGLSKGSSPAHSPELVLELPSAAAAKSFAASGPFAVTILPSGLTTGWPTSTAFPFFISITATGYHQP